MATEKVAIQLRISSPDARGTAKELAAVELQIEQITKQLKEAKKQADGDTYARLRDEQIKLQSEGVKLRKEIRDQQRAFREQEFPSDSIIGLRRQYRLLKREIDGIGESDPKFDRLADEAARVADRINELNKQSGSFKDNIGRYEESIGSALDATSGFFSGGGISALAGGLAGSVLGGGFLKAAELAIDMGVAVAETVDEVRTLNRTVRQLADVTEGAEGAITARALAIGRTFDKDVNEVLKQADKLTKDFGISFERSFNLIQTGLLAGADLNGNFLDQLREYPALFAEIGGNADQFVSILTQAEIEGVFADKAIDAVKEFGLSVREMTDATAEAFTSIGISQDQVAQDIEDGGIIKVLERTQMQLNQFRDDSPEVGKALADIFRGAGEDAGIKFLRTVDLSAEGLENLIDLSDKTVQRQLAQIEANEMLAESQTRFNAALGETTFFVGFFEKLKAIGFEVLTGIIQRFKVIRNIVLTLFGAEDLPVTIWEVIAEDAATAAKAQSELEKERKEQENEEQKRASAEQARIKAREEAKKREREGEIGSINELEARLQKLNETLSKTADIDTRVKLSLEIEDVEAQIREQQAVLRNALDNLDGGAAVGLESIGNQETELFGKIAAEQFVKGAVAGIEEDDSFIEAVGNQFIQALGLESAAREEALRKEEELLKELREKGDEEFKKAQEIRKERRQQDLEEQQEFEEKRLAIVSTGFEQAGKLLGQFLVEGQKGFDKFFQGFVLTLLGVIEKTVLLYTAQIVAREIAEKSFAGIATSALLTGLVKGFFSAIKAQVRNLYEGGQVMPVNQEQLQLVQAQLMGAGKVRGSAKNKVQPTSRGGDNVLVRLKVGEVVMNERQQARLEQVAGGGIWKYLGIPGFNTGGRVTDPKSGHVADPKSGHASTQSNTNVSNVTTYKRGVSISKVTSMLPGFNTGGIIGGVPSTVSGNIPQIINPSTFETQAAALDTEVTLSNEQIMMFASVVASETATAIREEIEIENRRAENQKILQESLSK